MVNVFIKTLSLCLICVGWNASATHEFEEDDLKKTSNLSSVPEQELNVHLLRPLLKDQLDPCQELDALKNISLSPNELNELTDCLTNFYYTKHIIDSQNSSSLCYYQLKQDLYVVDFLAKLAIEGLQYNLNRSFDERQKDETGFIDRLTSIFQKLYNAETECLFKPKPSMFSESQLSKYK